MAVPGEVSFWLIMGLIGMSAYYLLMPLRVRFKTKFAAHPKLRALDFESLPPSVAQFLMTRTKRVFDLGFAEPTLIQTRSSAEVSSYFILLVNRQTADKAYVSCVVGSTGLQAFSVEFSARFDSGEVFDTHNVKDPLSGPPAPTQIRTQVPMVTDLQELYDLHRFVIDQHVVRGQKILFKPGEALEYVARYTFQESYEKKVARGWMYYDPKDDVYRPTLKGAYLMTWGLMQPFKAIRKIVLDNRARKTLAEFERAGSMRRRPEAIPAAEEWRESMNTPQDVVCDTPSQHAVSVLPADDPQSQTLEQLQQAALQHNSQPDYGPELAQIERLQKAQSSWFSALLVLAVSVLLFVTAGAVSWSVRFALLLVPILFFHELGHYLAMRVFKYRNLRMFFIPFLGAAVSGQHYNVPGWKKALVSLLGPVPGILCAPALGVAGILLHQKILIEIALLMLILNGINLLPILPLDGGWVLHAILFSRHYLLDAAFRLLASCLLVVGGLLLPDRLLVGLGVLLLFSLPLSYRLGKIARRLRNSIPSSSPDGQSIPADTACLILDEFKTSLKGANAQTRARYTLQVFEALNTRPPGWLPTFGLATVHAGSLLLAVVLSAVFMHAQHGKFRRIAEQATLMPKHGLEPGGMHAWYGRAVNDQSPWTPLTIGTTFATQEQAAAGLEQLKHELPDRSAMRLFGQTLLVELMEKYRLAAEEMKKRRVEQMKEEGPESVDLKIIDVFAQRPSPGKSGPVQNRDKEQQGKVLAERKELLQKWHLQLGELMGQLPSVNGQPKPGANRFSCSTGFAMHTGVLMRFHGMQFVRPAAGGPALVDWLRQRGCIDFKYDFEPAANQGEDELD